MSERWRTSKLLTRLGQVWDRLGGSYWFFPAAMALGAALLSFAAIALDLRLADDWESKMGWVFQNKPEGARTLLATVAGSMIGVAGVTFSITTASVTQAAQQFGPRLISNLMRDRGNQIVLGTFVATFVYCLMVLRTVQSSGQTLEAFVPQLSIMIALVLALASLGGLIYFLHHVPEMTNVSNLVAGVGQELSRKLRTLGQADDQSKPAVDLPPDFEDGARGIPSRCAGYIGSIDEEALASLAQERDLVLVLRCLPGRFIRESEPLVLAWPAVRAGCDLDADVRDTFTIGPERTPSQDVLFLADELVEVAARALSPSMNDPFTAMSCMDWLGNALTMSARNPPPAAIRSGKNGHLRFWGNRTTFSELLDRTFGRLRFYVQSDRTANLHLLDVLASLSKELRAPEQRHAVATLVRDLRTGAESASRHPEDVKAVELRHRGLEDRLMT